MASACGILVTAYVGLVREVIFSDVGFKMSTVWLSQDTVFIMSSHIYLPAIYNIIIIVNLMPGCKPPCPDNYYCVCYQIRLEHN